MTFISQNVLPGGMHEPATCQALHKVAIILPYRNREAQLKMFLSYMHPILQRQELEDGIYVVEQVRMTAI